jgi:hypothetical protein
MAQSLRASDTRHRGLGEQAEPLTRQVASAPMAGQTPHQKIPPVFTGQSSELLGQSLDVQG